MVLAFKKFYVMLNNIFLTKAERTIQPKLFEELCEF